jgi:lipopolysaccharide transport system ATP-binding protein
MFSMPILPRGDYCIAAAVATGTQENHRQHHWVHDAMIIKSISSSVSTGMIGMPMQSIRLAVEDSADV